MVLSRQVLRRDESGKPSAILEINRDITARKQAQEALERSEERFRLLVDSAKDYAIFMLDPGGQIATWNDGAERIKGIAPMKSSASIFRASTRRKISIRGQARHELKMAAPRAV